jgi:hypothetical protein
MSEVALCMVFLSRGIYLFFFAQSSFASIEFCINRVLHQSSFASIEFCINRVLHQSSFDEKIHFLIYLIFNI